MQRRCYQFLVTDAHANPHKAYTFFKSPHIYVITDTVFQKLQSPR